jgi:CRISPR/Cas system-associated exonuclease Cas4 (RecB family)
MLINHQSVSRKKCYDTCEQQYKFRYHLKVPRPGPEPFYFTYGTIVHRVAEVYVENRGEMQIGDIAKDLLRGKIDLDDKGRKCPPIEDDYQKKFQKHLRAIQKLTERIGTGGIVEHKFEYDLDPPNKRTILGFIDRLIIADGKAFIIDYKTTKKGKWRVNKQTVKDDLQLRTYSRVVQREFGIAPENIRAALFYLEGEEIVACTYSEESLIKAEQELLRSFKMIERSDPDRVWGKVGWHCKNCDYATMCPFYSADSKAMTEFDGDMSSIGGGW